MIAAAERLTLTIQFYGGQELPLKILKFVGIIFVIIFFKF